MQVLSKASPIGVTCGHYVHPWTNSCSEATCGLFLCSVVYSLRIYTTVYCLALLTKGKIPNIEELHKTAKGILQSTAFLSFTSFGYSAFLCFLRYLFGNYNIVTISGLPAFLSSVFAILIERPSRRVLLALYVSNVATETVWNMLVYRNMVTNINYGSVGIFAGSIAVLLALFKSGLHKKQGKAHTDAMFNILKFIIGPYEENNYSHKPKEIDTIHREQEDNKETEKPRRWLTGKRKKNFVFYLVIKAVRLYKQFINKIKCCDRYHACPHPFSCVFYTLQGGTKMFSLGVGIQVVLKLVFNAKTVLSNPKKISDIIFKKQNLDLALFLGGASGMFRACMCVLRRMTGKDDPSYAVPAGLLAGLAFIKYPDTTIALYVFWKMLHITYNLGIDKGILPKIPGFTIFLYCLSTGLLFHAALVEPLNLRPSYWKFLHSISGGRVAVMDRKPMDVWGLETSKMLIETLRKTKTKPVISWYLVK